MKHNIPFQLLQLTAILLFVSLTACSKKNENETTHQLQKIQISGEIQGTFYNITYLDAAGRNYHKEIKASLRDFDKTFSIFDSLSLISRINANEANTILNESFIKLFTLSQNIAEKTEGAFDLTVAPLVKLWGFNNGKRITVDQAMIDSVKTFVGYKKIQLKGKKLLKTHPNVTLDANAIAQGYSCDIIADLLERKGVKNYLVEIGGELKTKGKSPRNDAWKIGINKPIDDSTSTISEIQQILHLENVALATSGNYRKFYFHEGRKYGHSIDPISGYPTTHNLLSVTVIATDGITADAYATAFMVMGIVKSMALLQKLSNIEAYFIYQNEAGENEVLYTRGFKKYLEN